MAYADLNSVSNPVTGGTAPAAWGDQARDNDEFNYRRKDASCKSNILPAIATGADVVMDFSTGVDWDPSGMIGASYLDLPVAGIWTFTTIVNWWNTIIAGDRQSNFLLNGGGGLSVVYATITGGGDCAYSHTEPDRYYAAHDHVGYNLKHNAGGTINAFVSISARWISP